MSILSFIGSFIGAFFKSLFRKSDQERLGVAEERITEYEKRDALKKAMTEAPKASGKRDLLKRLRKGSLILALVLCACAKPIPVSVCPQLKNWTPEQQNRLADELEQLPENCMIVEAMQDYYSVRQEIKICIKNGG